MPVGLHQILMFLTAIVAFFAGGFSAWQAREELQAAGLPMWGIAFAPIVSMFGTVLLFHLIPALCPGCRWPVALLRSGERFYYRCMRCGHVHCTIWGRRRTQCAPYRTGVPLFRVSTLESGTRRITFSGHTDRPSTLRLSIRPAPRPGVERKLATPIEATVSDDRDQTIVRVVDPIKNWDGQHAAYPLGTCLELRHP